MSLIVKKKDELNTWKIIADDSCPVVQTLANLIKKCDKHNVFSFPNRKEEISKTLFAELDNSPWSLLLIDDKDQKYHGPEAIPFILKNLPSGRLAVVVYLLPGTMWLTRQLYLLVSKNKRKLSGKALSLQSLNLPEQLL